MPDASTADGVVSVRRELATVVASVNGSAAAPSEAALVRVVGPYDKFFKRFIDLAGSVLCLLILLPVIAVVALSVRLMLGPNIFFCQERVGRHGKTFRMIKFRSMMADRRSDQSGSDNTDYDGSDRRQTHKSLNDPRHTPVGRFIRKWSLDELPQLFNVVKGDMSLVGPRPELVRVAQAHNLVDHPRHLVRPGITGLWQVSRERSSLLHENVDIDTRYVTRVTFVGDCKILVRTVGAVLRARGR